MRTPHHMPGVLYVASTNDLIVVPNNICAIEWIVQFPIIDRLGDIIREVPSPVPAMMTQINLN